MKSDWFFEVNNNRFFKLRITFFRVVHGLVVVEVVKHCVKFSVPLSNTNFKQITRGILYYIFHAKYFLVILVNFFFNFESFRKSALNPPMNLYVAISASPCHVLIGSAAGTSHLSGFFVEK